MWKVLLLVTAFFAGCAGICALEYVLARRKSRVPGLLMPVAALIGGAAGLLHVQCEGFSDYLDAFVPLFLPALALWLIYANVHQKPKKGTGA